VFVRAECVERSYKNLFQIKIKNLLESLT